MNDAGLIARPQVAAHVLPPAPPKMTIRKLDFFYGRFHALLLAATALVAAIYPMWLAVRLPIAQTLRQEVVS